MSEMPSINWQEARSKLTDHEFAIAQKIFKSNGELRASKPSIKFEVRPDHPWGGNARHNDINDASAAYVWRMVAFQISPRAQHQCMPVMCEFDIDIDDHDARRAHCNGLDSIVSKLVDLVPMRQWHGVIRWGNAFGVLGTPQYNDNGAVVYRGIERESDNVKVIK